MKITHVYLQNFCKFYGTNVLDVDFSDKTALLGQNEVGKSTVKLAIFDVLNLHDEKDREITGIRPHDTNGVEIDDVDIVRAVTFEIDGKEKTLKKTTRQKRNKDGAITGSGTDYSINDVPYKMADYNQFINDNISNLKTLPYCLNAMALLSKSPTDQRTVLSNFFGTHTDQEICDMFPPFAELKPLFDDGDLDQIKKVCRGKLNGTGGRNGSKGLIKERDDISTAIDTIRSTRSYVDLAELELQKKSYEPQLKEIEDKLADNNKFLEERQAITDGILQLKFKQNDMEREANAENEKKRQELMAQLHDLERQKSRLEADISSKVRSKETLESSVAQMKKELDDIRIEWEKANQLAFDEADTDCPMCGQKLPEGKIEALKDDFEAKKKANLEKVTDKGNLLSGNIKTFEGDIKVTEKDIADYRAELEEIEEKEEVVKQEYDKIPTEMDMSTNAEYVALTKEIEEKEKSLPEENAFADIKRELEQERAELIRRISAVDTRIEDGNKNNQSIDNDIAVKEEERTDLNQQIADWERKLDLLKQFTRKKNELLQDDVNNRLEFATAKLFRPLLNGDTEECCDFVYKGEAYARNLNHGARMLTELDICRAFQKKAGVVFPIIVDDTESVDDWRIPQFDNQLIMLEHTQDKDLVIKEV
jgi:DNA repair protein SbcC/Rad50